MVFPQSIELLQQGALWTTPFHSPTISPSASVSCWQAFKQASQLEHVLDATAASCEELKATHQATLDELNRLKRWIYGRRRERTIEAGGQRHLFDLEPAATAASGESSGEASRQQVAAHGRRRRRELDLSQLPHYRHELDISPAERICDCCGREKDRIGKDETRILDYVPSKLEVHVHVRPKHAHRFVSKRRCRCLIESRVAWSSWSGVRYRRVPWARPSPTLAISGGRCGAIPKTVA